MFLSTQKLFMEKTMFRAIEVLIEYIEGLLYGKTCTERD